MATTSSIKICPDCRNTLPEDTPQFCPSCGSDSAYINAKRRESRPKDFEPIRSIYGQFVGKIEDAEKQAKRDHASNPDKPNVDPIIELQGKMLLVYKHMSPQDKLLVLRDAMEVMKLILHSGLSGDEMKPLIEIGKNIGAISTAADSFISARKSAIRV